MPYCTDCGTEIAATARFCPECGARQPEDGAGGGDQRSHDDPADGERADGIRDTDDTTRPADDRNDGSHPGWEAGESTKEPRSGPREADSHQDESAWGQSAETGDAWDQARDEQGAGRQGHPRQQAGGHQQGSPHQRGGPHEEHRRPSDEEKALSFAIDYPKRAGWKPVLVGAALVLLSFFIIPLIILVGYGYRVARSAAADRPLPPEMDDWGGFLVDGLRFIAVFLVPTIVVAFSFGIVIGILELSGAGGLALLLQFVSNIVTSYVAAAFLVAFVGANNIGQAFTDGTAVDLMKSEAYATAWIGYFILQIVLSFLAVFSIITIVGPLFVVAFSILLLGAYWGRFYARATETGLVAPPKQAEGPAPAGQEDVEPRR